MKPRIKIIKEQYEDRYKYDCYVTVNYYINESDKTVVCKLEPFCLSNSHFNYYDLSTCSEYVIAANRDFFNTCNNKNTTFIGKAKCMEEDTFDIDFGKKLAYDKAMLKMLNAKRTFFEGDTQTFKTFTDLSTLLVLKTNEQIIKVGERKRKKIERTM